MEFLSWLVTTVRTYPFVFVGGFLVLSLYWLEHHYREYLLSWAWPDGAWFIALVSTLLLWSGRVAVSYTHLTLPTKA
mgnify:CR=1 FL=1